MSDKPFIRSAIRHEGQFVNAYLAPLDTMEGAQLLASIRVCVCRMDRRAYEDFQELVAGFVMRQVAAATGTTPRVVLEQAPEHERAGHG